MLALPSALIADSTYLQLQRESTNYLCFRRLENCHGIDFMLSSCNGKGGRHSGVEERMDFSTHQDAFYVLSVDFRCRIAVTHF